MKSGLDSSDTGVDGGLDSREQKAVRILAEVNGMRLMDLGGCLDRSIWTSTCGDPIYFGQPHELQEMGNEIA